MAYLDLTNEMNGVASIKSRAKAKLAWWGINTNLARFIDQFGDSACITYVLDGRLRTSPMDEKTRIDLNSGLMVVRDQDDRTIYHHIRLTDCRAISSVEAKKLIVGHLAASDLNNGPRH